MSFLTKRNSILVLLLVTALSVLFTVGLRNTKLDYDFEKFFPESDPETEFYNTHRDTFATDNDFVLIGIENKAGIYQKDFLTEVDRFIAAIDTIDVVDTTLSILSLQYPGMDTAYHYVDLVRDSLSLDSLHIKESPDIYEKWVSTTQTSLRIYVKHNDYLSKVKCDKVAADLKFIESKFNFDEVYLAGRSVGQSYYTGLMLQELVFFTLASVILLVGFLIIAFRSVWGVWLPMLIVLLSVLWTVGFMGLVNQPVNLVLTMLPTILFVVGISDVVHIVSKYIEELRNGLTKKEALSLSIKEIGLATLLTSFTTSIGFFTLLTSSIVPIKEFGIYTGIGVVLAFTLSILVLPSVFYLIPTPKIAIKGKSDFWKPKLTKLYGEIQRKEKLIYITFALLLGIACWGLSKLEVNNYLLEDLTEDDPMKLNFVFFEENYSGVRPFELSVKRKDGESVLEYDRMKQLNDLDSLVVAMYPAKEIQSVLTAFKFGNRAYNGGVNSKYCFPESKRTFAKIRSKMYPKNGEPNELISGFVSKDQSTIRMIGTVPDLGGNFFREINNKFEEIVIKQFPEYEIHQTGTAYLIDKNNNYLSKSMVGSLAIAFGVIAIIVGFIFRSFVMVVISLVVNMLPLLFIGAVMGFTGTDVKVSTSIIFTIAFGIAVDDTIHFISKLKLELSKKLPLEIAIENTFIHTGKAITLTTLILCSGFLTLLWSNFLGTYYVGLLISCTLFFALVTDLMLLPLLVKSFYKVKKKA